VFAVENHDQEFGDRSGLKQFSVTQTGQLLQCGSPGGWV